jgi:hypothetical protein
MMHRLPPLPSFGMKWYLFNDQLFWPCHYVRERETEQTKAPTSIIDMNSNQIVQRCQTTNNEWLITTAKKNECNAQQIYLSPTN